MITTIKNITDLMLQPHQDISLFDLTFIPKPLNPDSNQPIYTRLNPIING